MNRTIKKENKMGLEDKETKLNSSIGQVNKGCLVTNTYTSLMFIFSQETTLFFKGLS